MNIINKLFHKHKYEIQIISGVSTFGNFYPHSMDNKNEIRCYCPICRKVFVAVEILGDGSLKKIENVRQLPTWSKE